jgi:hypothetical protein
MADLIKDANDPNFKSLLSKLRAIKWIDKVVFTPKTKTALGNYEFNWSLQGQLCLIVIKKQMKGHLLWKQSNAFLKSLNEQEEAFFHENMLSTVPDNL